MGGRKVWSILVLFVLFGMVQAEIPTTLASFAIPSSPQVLNISTRNTTVVFTADYNFTYQGSKGVVPNAIATLYIDGTPMHASYYGSYTDSQGTYYGAYRTLANLPVGNHTWYITTGASNFTTQTGPTQTFVVDSIPTTLASFVIPPSNQIASMTTGVVPVVFTADYNFTYQGTNGIVPNATATLYIDGTPMRASYYGSSTSGGTYYGAYRMLVNLPVGSHTWYMTAGAPSFKTQTVPTQTFVVNPIPTTLASFIIPSSPQVLNITTELVPVVFTADYDFTYEGTKGVVPNATATLYIDGTPINLPYTKAYTDSQGTYYGAYRMLVNLPVGSHTWYMTAGAPSFKTQTGPTQTFVVNPIPTTLASFAIPASPQRASSDIGGVSVLLTADYNFTYQGTNGIVPNATATLYIDGTPMRAGHWGVPTGAPDLHCGEYGKLVNLPVGSHTWYMTAGAPSFKTQTGPTQTFVVNPIPTALTQSVTPASKTATGSVQPTFRCNYTYTGSPLSEATVFVIVDSELYTATFFGYTTKSGTTGDFRYSNVILYAGNHTWYCNASMSGGFQPQIGSIQNYIVNSSGGGGGGGKPPEILQQVPLTPTGTTWTLLVILIAIIGLGVGYLVIREALFFTATRKTKKK